MGVEIKQFTAGSCYSYIVSCEREAIVIDPHISLGDGYSKYIKKNNLKLKYIIDTHTHADHFSLGSVLKKIYSAPVLMHEKAVSQVAGKRLKDGDSISVGTLDLKVIYSPGHTDDTINIYGDGFIFTADVLLIGSVGRTDFQNGSPESLFDTLQKLKTLPENTVVYPGHDYNEKRTSTIKKEKRNNLFLAEGDRVKFAENMRSKTLTKPFNMDNIIRVNRSGEAVSLEMIAPGDAYQLIAKDPNFKLLDVRSPSEFSEAHIKDSINMPIDTLSAKLDELGDKASSYIVLCRTGTRSAMAADMLIQSGIKTVRVLDGGMIKWERERLPLVKGQKIISLERQVRIIAGSLMLSGLLLCRFAHPWFIGIPVFVACGLVYAGLTDNCMMGMLLMKLPYNKKQFKSKAGGTCSMS
ncbi:MAG: MBL fold metallo-hydrolase [Candidatus Omnitrophica bacterium]|nr:MBL fold metallo-hydrolase [Candidatus Omnitrophota bacterium]